MFNHCNKRPENVLNSKEMESFLFDMYLLEASLHTGNRFYKTPREKQFYYEALFEKHQITKSDYDSSVVWYTQNPKEYSRIYEKVLKRIDTLQTSVLQRKYHPIDSLHFIEKQKLWKKIRFYILNKKLFAKKMFFEIADTNFTSQDIYQLSFTQHLSASHSDVQPYAVMYVNYLNGTVDSISTLLSDSVKKRYTLTFKARLPLKIKSVSGWLLRYDTTKYRIKGKINSIQLYRKFNPYRQDSIRQAIHQLDTTSYLPPSTTLLNKPKMQSKNKLKSNTIQMMLKNKEVQKK